MLQHFLFLKMMAFAARLHELNTKSNLRQIIFEDEMFFHGISSMRFSCASNSARISAGKSGPTLIWRQS